MKCPPGLVLKIELNIAYKSRSQPKFVIVFFIVQVIPLGPKERDMYFRHLSPFFFFFFLGGGGYYFMLLECHDVTCVK